MHCNLSNRSNKVKLKQTKDESHHTITGLVWFCYCTGVQLGLDAVVQQLSLSVLLLIVSLARVHARNRDNLERFRALADVARRVGGCETTHKIRNRQAASTAAKQIKHTVAVDHEAAVGGEGRDGDAAVGVGGAAGAARRATAHGLQRAVACVIGLNANTDTH